MHNCIKKVKNFMNIDLEKIKNLSDENWINSALELFSLFLPGFIYLFTIRQDLFVNFDTFRLVMVSIFYSLPGYLIVSNRLARSNTLRQQNSFQNELHDIEVEIHKEIFEIESLNFKGAEKMYKPTLRRLQKLKSQTNYLQRLKVSIIITSVVFTYLTVYLHPEHLLNPSGFWTFYYVWLLLETYFVLYLSRKK